MEVAHRSSIVPSAHFHGESYCPNTKIPFPSELPDPDLHILTSGGRRIPAHSAILASASPVLENLIDRPRKHRRSDRVVPILGVPCDAVVAFVEFIYSSRCSESEMAKYDIHLLALAHVYSVPQLKQRCIKELSQRLTIHNVVDLLQLSRLCDASNLYLHCMKLINANFPSVQNTEAWKFLQKHDPHLELHILHFIDESVKRMKKITRQREEQTLYSQLSDAMDCLDHICTHGCTHVGPSDMQLLNKSSSSSCPNYTTCMALQLLFKHFATCQTRSSAIDGDGCTRCKRMWKLLRLHSSICDRTDHTCRVPLCGQMKQHQHTPRWSLLVRKVVSAKAMSSLSRTIHTKRKRPHLIIIDSYDNSRVRTLNLNLNSPSILAI